MRRTPLTRKNWMAPKGKKKNGQRRSPSKENGSATWHRTRAWVLDRNHGRCEARCEGVCTTKAEHVHHIVLRSRGGSDDPANLAAVCNSCHRHIHDNPAWATEHGFMRSKWSA